MASPAAAPAPPTPFERRLGAEWDLLCALAARNPGRLDGLGAEDSALCACLQGTPARMLDGSVRQEHRVRLEYPRFFPSVPLELYLETPVLHPNVHPETGFVCLWDRHQAANTAEDAVHRTVAMLGWKLFNLSPDHTMQPAAAALATAQGDGLRAELAAPPLLGIRGFAVYPRAASPAMRRRLS